MENKFSDRRKHKRFTVDNKVFVLWHNKAAQAIDISEGGMAIHVTDFIVDQIVDSPEPLSDDWKTTFLCETTETIITELPVKLVRKEEKEFSRFAVIATQTVGVKFNNPNANQQKQIRQHISGLSKKS